MAIDSQIQPRTSTRFRPQEFIMWLNIGAKTHIDTEYPEKMKPIDEMGKPCACASFGKKGAMEL